MSPGEAQDQRANDNRRERLLWVLSAATFLIFVQAYMVAPLIPRRPGQRLLGTRQVGQLEARAASARASRSVWT